MKWAKWGQGLVVWVALACGNEESDVVMTCELLPTHSQASSALEVLDREVGDRVVRLATMCAQVATSAGLTVAVDIGPDMSEQDLRAVCDRASQVVGDVLSEGGSVTQVTEAQCVIPAGPESTCAASADCDDFCVGICQAQSAFESECSDGDYQLDGVTHPALVDVEKLVEGHAAIVEWVSLSSAALPKLQGALTTRELVVESACEPLVEDMIRDLQHQANRLTLLTLEAETGSVRPQAGNASYKR